jgi:transposase
VYCLRIGNSGESGIENIVINPASIEIAANDRVKTDKRDAKKLAELLSLKRLRGIRIPTVAEEEHRMLTRTREQLTQQRTKVSNQILAKIRYLGLEIQDLPDHLDKHFIAQLLAAPLPDEIHSALKALTTVWETLHQEVETIDKKLAE